MKSPRILIVEDEHALARALAATVEHAGASCDIAASAARAHQLLAANRQSYAAMILDIGLPDQNGLCFLASLGEEFDLPTIVITAHGEIQNNITARKLGVLEFFQKPVDFDAFSRSLRAVVQSAGSTAGASTPPRVETGAYIGAARSTRQALQQIAHACASDEPVLVRGETGTGKSHTARLIQTYGLRSHEQAVTLVAGPSTSIAELDASLVAATGGALILEDIGQFSDTVQAELIRQIELRSRDGFLRLIATSSDDLYQAVRAGRLRSELFYRLQILEVPLPPLRHRMDDLPALLAYFLGQLRPGRHIRVSEPALERLFAHNWPGNLRELHNVVAFALTVSTEATVIDPPHLPSYLPRQPQSGQAGRLPAPLLSELNAWLDQYFEATPQPAYRDLELRLEAALIEQLLERYEGKLAPMASALQANRSTLRRKLRGPEEQE